MSLTNWSETIVIAELQDEPSLSEDLSALAARFEQDGDHRLNNRPTLAAECRGARAAIAAAFGAPFDRHV